MNENIDTLMRMGKDSKELDIYERRLLKTILYKELKSKFRPLSKAEVDIFMIRLQGAVYENNREKIGKILKEIKERWYEIENHQKGKI